MDDNHEDVAGPAPYGQRDAGSLEAWMWFHEQLLDDIVAQARSEGLIPGEADS